MNTKNTFRLKIITSILGATGGFLYWKFIGCTTGTCPIQSVWYLSTLWGTAMGYLLGDLAGSFLIRKETKSE